MSTQKSNPIQLSLTPLTLLAFLFGICEIVAGTVASQIESGWMQGVLVTFVVLFPFFLAASFFVILWDRSHVLYPPQPFDGDAGPKGDTMRGFPPLVKRQMELVQQVEAAPLDRESHLALVASLLSNSTKQLLILMRERLISLPLDQTVRVKFELPGEEAWSESGQISLPQLCEKLDGTKFVTCSDDRLVSLTETGHTFAEWLVAKGEKADFFSSDFGEWGTSRERVLAGAEMITEAQDILAKLDAELQLPDRAKAAEIPVFAPAPDGESQHSFPTL